MHDRRESQEPLSPRAERWKHNCFITMSLFSTLTFSVLPVRLQVRDKIDHEGAIATRSARRCSTSTEDPIGFVTKLHSQHRASSSGKTE